MPTNSGPRAVIVIAIIAVWLLPHLFKVYPSTSGIGSWYALQHRAHA